MEKKRRAKENFAITPFFLRSAVYLYAPIFFSLFFVLPIYAHICIYLIYVYVLAWFLFSPMIAREGHKISRTYTLYLYYGVPLRGDDKMSNRSSGTVYAYIDDQFNTVAKEKAREEKKIRDKLRENEGICLFGPIK
jgi:hypothetical protein